MKVTLNNLGPLKQAEFELGDMTVIFGMNNTGKTYAAYAIGGASDDDLLSDYPQLRPEDIRACIAYAAEASRARAMPLEIEGVSHEIQAR